MENTYLGRGNKSVRQSIFLKKVCDEWRRDTCSFCTIPKVITTLSTAETLKLKMSRQIYTITVLSASAQKRRVFSNNQSQTVSGDGKPKGGVQCRLTIFRLVEWNEIFNKTLYNGVAVKDVTFFIQNTHRFHFKIFVFEEGREMVYNRRGFRPKLGYLTFFQWTNWKVSASDN